MQNRKAKEDNKAASLEKRVLLISLGVLLVGCIGYFSSPRGPLLFYMFAHVGALGLLGMIGGAVGILARKRGRSYPTAFFLGSMLPIASGIVAVGMIGDQVSCGGSVSLAVAALVTIFYLFAKKKTLASSVHAE